MIAFTRRPRVATSLLEETRRQYNEGGFVESLRLFQRITRDVLGADSDSFREQKKYYDKRVKEKNLKIGDFAYVNRPHVLSTI